MQRLEAENRTLAQRQAQGGAKSRATTSPTQKGATMPEDDPNVIVMTCPAGVSAGQVLIATTGAEAHTFWECFRSFSAHFGFLATCCGHLEVHVLVKRGHFERFRPPSARFGLVLGSFRADLASF